ncbi:hypothetical protein Tco_1346770 [Tanacetum coccineum]
MGQSIQTIHILGERRNKVYDPFLKVGLGYQNPEHLKKAIAAQPKMYDDERLHITKLNVDSPDSEETLEDAEEKFSAEQTYFSTPSTSNVSSESSKEIPDLPTLKMPNEKLKQELTEEVQEMLNFFESMEKKVETQFKKDNMFQNEIDRLLDASFTREIKDGVLIPVTEQVNEILMIEKEKISSDFKDIQANFFKRIKILENGFKQSQAQSINFELKLQHQKEKMACDNSWKSKMIKLSDENVLLKTQVESVVQERENIKLEYQKLFNSIKATRVQQQREVMS